MPRTPIHHDDAPGEPFHMPEEDLQDGWADDDRASMDDYWANRDYIEPMVSSNEPTLWNQLQIGDTLLYVSNLGCLRRAKDPFWCITRGVPLTGTPYSYVMIEIAPHESTMFFVHDLVWKAFQGTVPDGWEVRHKPYVPYEFHREYPNDLIHLDIYPTLPTGSADDLAAP